MSRITVDTSALKQHNNIRPSRQTNPIIYGYFPHKTYNEIAIARVNRTLCVLLGILIFVSLVSYYFVTSSEMTLNKIGKETIKLNNENVELQNKLDNMQSYDNVDQVVRKNNLLNTAQQVIEVPAAVASNVNSKTANVRDVKDSYKWSMGY